MKIEEQHAIVRRVPFLETCKTLNWQPATEKVWVRLHDGTHQVMTMEELRLTNESIDAFDGIGYPTVVYSAPSFEEIWEILPKKIESDRLFEDDLVLNGNTFYYRSEFLEWIENNHLSEAAAKLYIKLKEQNLLPQ